MTDTNKKVEVKGGISPMAAAVAGAVIGVGAAVAGAVAMNNDNNRTKARKVLTDAKDKTAGFVGDIQKAVQGKTDEVNESIAKGKIKADKVVKVIKS